MRIVGIGRLGRDAELRYTSAGDAVANLALAFNYGRKDSEGKQPTQWVDASLWGERAKSLAEHLVKGQQVFVVIRDAHIETFETRDGRHGSKIVGVIGDLEFAGSRPDQTRQPQQNRQPAQQPPQQQQPLHPGDLDDDVAF